MVTTRFADLASSIETEVQTLTLAFESFSAWRAMLEQTNPPLMALKQMLPADRYEALIAGAHALIDEENRAEDGRIVLESGYLSVIALR